MAAGNRVAVLLVLALLAAAPCAALAEQPPVRVYTAADGLAAFDVHGVLADSRGFLWFRTADGLSRFDGYAFTTYTTDDGLPDRRVSEVVETRAGDYWVATQGGLCRFDPRGVRGSTTSPPFVRVRFAEDAKADAVNALVESHDGTFWCGTDGGLYRLERREGRAAASRVDLGTAAGTVALVEDRQSDVWVGTLEPGGLYRVGPGGVERHALPERLATSELEALFEDRDGRLWVGTRQGLCFSEPATGDGRRVFVDPGSGAPGDRWTTSFYQTRDGALLVATVRGLWRVAPGARRPAFERMASLEGACDREIWGMTEDRDGNLWIATFCGALRMNRYGFTGYPIPNGIPPAVNSIFESLAGDLVATVNYGGRYLLRFDGSRFVVTLPRGARGGWGWGQSALQGRDGAWWVATGSGVLRYPVADRPDALDGASPQTIVPGRQAFRVFEDSRGSVWISTTQPPGLARWDPERDRVVDLTRATGVRDVEYTAFAESRDGAVWVGTSGGRLLRYANGGFEALGAAEGVPAGWLRDLHVDLGGRLWVASGLSGLARVDDPAAERPAIRVYRRADGLSTDNVWCVVDDALGRIYAGTERGVDRLDLSTGRVKHFTSADGLPNGHVEVSHRDRAGRLWFGTGFGLARLDPEPEREREPPRTLVTGLRVAGVARPVSALGELALAEPDLGPNQNNLTLEFLGLGVSLGEELRYQYRLEGADDDWSPPSPERTVTFANLAPGSYRFLARAVDADGAASAEPAAVAFTILAPVWKRWWFLTLAAVLVGLAVYSLHRYRVARLLEVERVRTRIAADLHDDIGANLTKIAVLSEVASYRLQGAAGDGSLAAIAHMSRESVTAMSDIVWAINPGRAGFRDLTRRMRQFANEAFVPRDVDVRFTAPDADELRLGDELRRHVYLIFKEAVNNVVRHADCGRAEISLKLDHNRLVLTVADDGRGFDPSEEVDGNGLANIRRRAAAIGAALEVRSADGLGATLTLSVPTRFKGHVLRRRHPV